MGESSVQIAIVAFVIGFIAWRIHAEGLDGFLRRLLSWRAAVILGATALALVLVYTALVSPR